MTACRFVLLLVPAALVAAEDAREIVRRAVAAEEAAYRLTSEYTYVERQDVRETEADGRVKKHEVRTFDVVFAEGTPYRRLLARNDVPLPEEEARHERDKLAWHVAERRRETPEQRARRISEWEKKQRRQREFLSEVPDAFLFRILREEVLNGRDTWVIEALPRPGYQPRTSVGRFLPKVKATLWIDKQDYGWPRLDAELFDTASIALFLVRLHKGTRVRMEQVRVNGEVWLPARLMAKASGRIALIKRFGGEWDTTYSKYRKFQADSRVVSYGTGR